MQHVQAVAILETVLWLMERWYVVRYNQANGMYADCRIMVKMVPNFKDIPKKYYFGF